jgi:hypothetical protein
MLAEECARQGQGNQGRRVRDEMTGRDRRYEPCVSRGLIGHCNGTPPPQPARKAYEAPSRHTDATSRNQNLHSLLALAIFHRYIAPTLRSKALDRLPLGRKRMRRGGRVVDCTALEMRSTCEGTVGSNPTLSAIIFPVGAENLDVWSVLLMITPTITPTAPTKRF